MGLKTNTAQPQTKAIESLGLGDFFKRTDGAKKTFVRGKYSRFAKRYECVNYDDISDFILLAKGKEVFVNFEF